MYSSPLSYKKTEISVFNFTFAHNHTPVTLLCQAHIAMAAMGGESRLVLAVPMTSLVCSGPPTCVATGQNLVHLSDPAPASSDLPPVIVPTRMLVQR